MKNAIFVRFPLCTVFSKGEKEIRRTLDISGFGVIFDLAEI
jgi:hypothetical protein